MSAQDVSNMVEWGLQYAARGWRVFTLSRSKKPYKGSHGFLDATTDPAAIERMWTQHPGANIGLATGAGLVVLDVDGSEGLAELKALTALHGPLPVTLCARTGNGFHIYLSGDGVKSSARGNLHVRGQGGYVMAPPSLHPNGRRYEWIDPSITVARLPDWLKGWMQGDKRNSEIGRQLTDVGGLPSHLGVLPRRQLALRAIEAIKTAETTWSPQEQNRIESALDAIPADNYEIWYKVGMILQSLQWIRGDGSDRGLELWDDWSQTCEAKYPGATELEAKWHSFGRSGHGGLGLGTLFALAQDHGWNQEKVSSADQVNGVESAPAMLPAGLSEPSSQRIYFDLNDDEQIRPTCANAFRAIGYLGITCSLDMFSEQMYIGGHRIQQWAGKLSDTAVHALRKIIRETWRFDPGTKNTEDAAIQKSLEHTYNPVTDYLAALRWDGVSRLPTWLHDYLGADQTALNAAIGSLILIAAVRRARVPGSKFDQIVVFEGREGTGKSQAVQILAGEHYSEQSVLAHTDKEQQEAIRGVWIHEIPELAGMKRTDVERIKAFASRTEDRARPAFGHFRVDLKRRCIFIGTTNEDAYLKSYTGNRRIWPVVTRAIDLSGLRAMRDQLWAEAAAREQAGASLVLDPRLWTQAGEEQEKRMEHDLWIEIIENHVNGERQINDLSVVELLTGPAFMLKPSELDQIKTQRAGRLLKKIGFEKYRKRENEGLIWRYRRNVGTT